MKLTRSILATFLTMSLVSVTFLSPAAQIISAQDSRISLQRGYRTGYSDGYMSGYRDAIDNAAKNYSKHNEYTRADRAYNKDYGTIEDYRDGYQQGFESGYSTGFEKRSFDATVPTDLSKRGIVTAKTAAAEASVESSSIEQPNTAVQSAAEIKSEETNTEPAADSTYTTSTVTETSVGGTVQTEKVSYQTNDNRTLIIPTDTELILELQNDINTEQSREGDKFTAKVISPYELSGATVEGRVSKIQKPGRLKRRSELLLSFDRIILNDSRWSNFNAVITEILPRKGDNVRSVDDEGTVEGRSTIKDDSIKVGATTGTGLVVGAIAGGPVGAAVGAGVGAAFGVGAVVVERGKHIKLDKNQQIRIKSSYDTQIR